MKLKIKDLLIFELIYILFIKFFIDYFNFSTSLWYLCDILNIFVFLLSFNKILKKVNSIRAKWVFLAIIFIFLVSFISFVANKQSPFLYIWGIRNIGRMFLLFTNCIFNFNKQDVLKILKVFYIAFVINFIISIFQFMIQGIQGDNLGGIFGISGSSNSFSLNLLIIISIFSLNLYINKKIKIARLILIIFSCIILVPLMELKAYYVIVVAMFFILLIGNNKLNFRAIKVLIIGVIALIASINILNIIYPESVKVFSLEGMQNYLSTDNGIGYSSTKDLSRANAIEQINTMFFNNNIKYKVFGMGLGSCETSNFSLFNSQFYEKYEYLHYRWFFHAMVYLEIGYSGLISFLLFFIACYFYVKKVLKGNKNINENDIYLLNYIKAIIIYSIILMFYNCSLRIESGYLLFFVLSIPFILSINEEVVDYKEALIFRKRKE